MKVMFCCRFYDFTNYPRSEIICLLTRLCFGDIFPASDKPVPSNFENPAYWKFSYCRIHRSITGWFNIYFSFTQIKKMIPAAAASFLLMLAASFVNGEVKPFDFNGIPECNFTSVGTKTITKLARKFTVKVEGKLNPNSFFDSEGYYDADGDRGTTLVLNGGLRSGYVYDFESGQAFNMINHTCTEDKLYETGCNSYALFIAEIAAHNNVSERCNLFGGPIVYTGLGNETVRAIRVDKWSQCVHDYRQNLTYVSHYYYSAGNVTSPSSTRDPVPIRFETRAPNATAPKNDSFVYDFTYYMPEVLDESVFLPPPGIYCKAWSRENKTMPRLPDQFSLSLLTTAEMLHEVHSMKINFDYKNRLVSFIADNVNGTQFPPVHTKGHSLYRIVHDYNTNVSFSMPLEAWLVGTDASRCTISLIDKDSLDVSSKNASDFHLRHADELFGMGRVGWIYIGEREFNNVPASVWSNQRTTATEVVTTEVYWLNETWTTSAAPVFAGFSSWITALNGTDLETYQTTVSEYRTLPFHWRTFDVDACLRSDSQRLITFTVGISNYTEMAMKVASFETGIRNALSNLTGASPVRFTDIIIDKVPGSNISAQIWVTVLDWKNPSVTRKVRSTGSASQESAQQVVDNLQKKFQDKDVPLNVTYGGKTETVTLQKGTMQSGEDLVKPTKRPIAPTTQTPPSSLPQEAGYTGGSMAGLAIAMIIIGGVAGMVAGFLLWKRNTGIAYQVYD